MYAIENNLIDGALQIKGFAVALTLNDLLRECLQYTPVGWVCKIQKRAFGPFNCDKGMNAEEDIVQIHASKEEVSRRIEAFCCRKRRDVDERNVKVFCGMRTMSDTSCARVDAVYFPRAGKSRFRVSRVNNKDGPQTSMCTSLEPPLDDFCGSNTGLEVGDRLAVMEQHMRLPVREEAETMQRIKNLEDRILYLEGVSLEYFASRPSLRQKPGEARLTTSSIPNTNEKNLSLSDIEERMWTLREKLKKKLGNREGHELLADVKPKDSSASDPKTRLSCVQSV